MGSQETKLSSCSQQRLWSDCGLIWAFARAHMPFLYLATKKWRGIVLYTPNRLSVSPSISASFRDSNLSSFWPIFFKLCMYIDFREEWFGIANGLNSFVNNGVMVLYWCQNVFFLNIFRANGWILIKFCIYTLIYTRSMLYVMHIIFGQFLTEFLALDRRQNFVYAQYLVN